MEDKKYVVLIAEDEPDLRELYTQSLSLAGFQVYAAENGAKALELLAQKKDFIDVILMDIVMPGMDGFEAIEKIEKEGAYKNIPLIVSTNLDNDEDKKQAMAMGADQYFVKSQKTPSELVEIVKKVCSSKAAPATKIV